MDWDQQTCLKLIKSYKSHRCLWDPTHPTYKKPFLKQDAWNEIGNVIECNVEEVKKKMDSLLASYRRERQKTMTAKLSNDADCTYKSKWFAFKSMHFLLGNYKPRKSLNFNSYKNKSMGDDEQENERNEQEGVRAAILEMSTNADSDEDIHSYTDLVAVGSRLDDGHTTIPLKKYKPEDPGTAEAYHTLKTTYESKLRKMDKSQAFGNLVASKHREYSKRTKAYVEHYINDILFDADLGKFEIDSNLTDSD